MNQLLISTKILSLSLSLSLSHIYYPAAFLSVESESMEGAKEEEEEEEEEESASEEALDRHDLELSLGFTWGNLLLVQLWTPYGHGGFTGYDTANARIILSLSVCVQFNFGSGVQEWSGVEFLKLRLPFVLQLQSVQLLTSHWLNIIIIIIIW